MVDWRLNFKIFFLLSTLFILTGCGVKADPVKYSETAIDSYVQGYTGSEPTAEEIERAKINKAAAEEATKKNEPTKAPIIPNP